MHKSGLNNINYIIFLSTGSQPKETSRRQQIVGILQDYGRGVLKKYHLSRDTNTVRAMPSIGGVEEQQDKQVWGVILDGILILSSQTSSVGHFWDTWGILYTDYITMLDILTLSFLGVTMALLCKRMHFLMGDIQCYLWLNRLKAVDNKTIHLPTILVLTGVLRSKGKTHGAGHPWDVLLFFFFFSKLVSGKL